ncbi:MAG: hemerythrin domain-containing protein [Acidimicrobiales bacterium]
MDLLDHLVKEHREAEALMDKLSDTDPGAERDRLLRELIDAVHTHMEVEEQFLYPIVVEDLDRKEADEGENEHDTARTVLERLDELKDEPGFAGALDMLKAGLTHHHSDEEEDMFPELREKVPERVAGLDAEALEEFVELTKDELYRKAARLGIEGRSSMSRDELGRAVSEAAS